MRQGGGSSQQAGATTAQRRAPARVQFPAVPRQPATAWSPQPPTNYTQHSPMGSHMRSMEAWLPPWLLNQSVKEMLSRARMSRMPPSGSNRERTMGEVPRASELATLSVKLSCTRLWAGRRGAPHRLGTRGGAEKACKGRQRQHAAWP